MRVLVVSNLYPPYILGGYEVGCSQVVRFLGDQGITVRVLTSIAPQSGTASEVARHLELMPFHDWVLTNRAGEGARSVRLRANLCHSGNVHRLYQCCREFRPDVIYFWNTIGIGGLSLLSCAQYLGIPWVMHLMDNVPLTLSEDPAGNPILPIRAHWNEHFEGRYILCSRRLLQEIALGGVDLQSRSIIVPNWIDPREYPSPLTFGKHERSRGEPLRLVFVGVLGEHKGAKILMRMAKLLEDRGIKFSLDIYGSIVDSEAIEIHERFDLVNSVRLMGFRPRQEVLQVLSEYDLFVFPTWDREPFAFAPLEAAMAGCVPVISDVNGNAEWLVHGLHCLKFQRTAEAFADGITRIAEGEWDLNSIRRLAYQAVSKSFDYRNCLRPLAGYLEEAAGTATDAVDVSEDELLGLVQFGERRLFQMYFGSL